MDLNKLDIFRLTNGKMGWLSERQTVLAQNIANADTPGYRAKDLRTPDFSAMLGVGRNIPVAKTSKGHLMGTVARTDFRTIQEKSRDVYEMNPNDNGVIMEEQLIKVNDSNMNYKLVANIYKKNLSMFKIALGVNR
tara:strand:- start:689 stop:1096 length:408 start_codon:yes stop_codon:yes gene_type:complete